MDPKSLLKSFWQLISVVRIVSVQALSIVLISYASGQFAVVYGVRGCNSFGNYLNPYFWLFGLVGLGTTLVAIFYIVFPAIWMQTIDRHLAFSATDTHLLFFSTQPVYVFLDVVFLIPAIALFTAGRAETLCQFNFEWGFGWSFLLMTLFYPVLRAASWYLFNRQIVAKKMAVPWLTLIMWWIIAIPMMVYVSFNYMNSKVYPRLRVPVVNTITFTGGLEKNPNFMTGIVRVQGILARDIAKCGLFGKDPDEFPYPSATVLLNMGEGNGQIMIKANRPFLVDLLELEADRKDSPIFEAFGRLSKLPNPSKRLVCGIGKADSEQKGGLALLEIEMPE